MQPSLNNGTEDLGPTSTTSFHEVWVSRAEKPPISQAVNIQPSPRDDIDWRGHDLAMARFSFNLLSAAFMKQNLKSCFFVLLLTASGRTRSALRNDDSMGDTDIEMDGVELENPWLPYGISYPPPLPDKVMLEGQSDEQDPDWGRDAYFVGARDDLWGEGFEVRAFNPSDPLGRGKFHKDEWNVQYMLGPANPLVHWDPISMKWGLQVLEKAGFINLEADVRNNAYADPKATAFLDDPTTLCLFHALSKSSDHITFQDPNFKTCKRLQVPVALTEAEQLSTFQKISDMRQWTSFQWEDNATMAMVPVAFGRTYPLDPQASSPYTCQSKITIVRSYCEVLMQYRNQDKTRDYLKFFRSVLWEARVPNSRKPEGLSNNLEPAFLRTTFLLANHLLHEFAHAFCFAYFEIPSLGLPRNPWVGDSRDNEFGHAMERHVHGGLPYANNFNDPERPDMGQTLRRGTYAPFGIYFAEKYRQWATPGDVKKMHLVKDSEKDFKSPCVYYPLAQRQIYNYFLTKTWTENVPRYGLDAAKFTKIKQWASSEMPGPDPSNPSHESTWR
ncbi:hypothetical protein KCU75_g2683, partial [Aureobasidium melanogenum]